MSSTDFYIVKQGGQPWSPRTVGHGDPANHKHSVGWIGCMLCAFTSAVNRLTGKRLSPLDVNTIVSGVKDGFVGGVLLNLPVAAATFGLRAPEKERIRSVIGDPALSALAIDSLAKGLAIIQVDHDSELPNGDPGGDHFVLATRRVAPSPQAPAHIECMDPAPGSLIWLDEQRLEGPSTWGSKVKHYKATSVAPIYKA